MYQTVAVNMFYMEQGNMTSMESPAVAPLSKRVPYTTRQICYLFGQSDGRGNFIPIHENTVARWRRLNKIPFIKLNCRQFRYPRTDVDQMLVAAAESRAMDMEISRA